MKTKVSIIGSGNISTHISEQLRLIQDFEILALYSRNQDSSRNLGERLNIPIVRNINKIPGDSDIVFLWVNDDNIQKVSLQLKEYISSDTIIVHSSGTKSVNEIDHYFANRACMWPLQTLAETDSNLKLKETPFFVCASDITIQQKVISIANQISDRVFKIDQETKLALHLAAVFANNYVNHLIGLSMDIVKDSGYDIDILLPILHKTMDNAITIGPDSAQTGPANREDYHTMATHLKIIEGNKSLKKLYLAISESIIQKNNK